MKKISIYGIGKMADYFMKNHDFTDEEIVEYIETTPKLSSYQGKRVVNVQSMNKKVDRIYLVNSYIETLTSLLAIGVEKKKIIICNTLLWKNYSYSNTEENGVVYDKNFAEEYEKKQGTQNVLAESMIYYKNKNTTKLKNGINIVDMKDYCRYTTLELLIEQIKDNSIDGSLAELGVFKGDFSKCINAHFPNRKLYLFDTFDGFDKRDVDVDIDNNFTSKEWFNEMNNFSYTSVNTVLNKMKYKNQCVVKKGWFPETIPTEEITYALVSLDCDLYEPMLAGLRYFYPRLNRGGVYDFA